MHLYSAELNCFARSLICSFGTLILCGALARGEEDQTRGDASRSVHSRTPVLLTFCATLPSVEAKGRWRERGRMGRSRGGASRTLAKRSPKSVKNVVRVLSALLKKAVEWEVIERMAATSRGPAPARCAHHVPLKALARCGDPDERTTAGGSCRPGARRRRERRQSSADVSGSWADRGADRRARLRRGGRTIVCLSSIWLVDMLGIRIVYTPAGRARSFKKARAAFKSAVSYASRNRSYVALTSFRASLRLPCVQYR
jgi:hypothetical protein